ncbi:unknown [Collinsella sp. CAG:289]|nr:unknown [Collinsella sp. CAG:289]
MAHDGVCLAKRQTALGQIIGNIGCGKVAHAALVAHSVLIDRPGFDHAGHDRKTLHERMRRIEGALLVLL